MKHLCLAVIATLGVAPIAAAQDAAIVYRLGRDTVAIEQFSRTPSNFTGDVLTRVGGVVAITI